MLCRLNSAALAFASLILLGGCASGPIDPSAVSVDEARERGTAVDRSERAEPERATTSARAASDSIASARERPAEAARERTSSASERASTESRSTSFTGSGSSDTAKLIAQLNDATRELAALRAANARLSAERSRPAPATRETAAKPDPADEKLAASLKSYAQFKQEIAAFFAEIERVRKDNGELKADLKDAADQVKQAKASVTRLEDELRAEKRARAEAERTVGELRDQLRTIARALSAAGLNADKLAAGVDADSRSRAGSR